MTSKIEHPRFGEITLSRTRRAKRISLSIRPPGKIRLSMPAYCSVRSGLEFLNQKEEWIAETLARMEKQYPQRIIAPPYSTSSRTLVFNMTGTDKISSRITTENIIIDHPSDMTFDDSEVQKAAEKAIIKALRMEAADLLPRLVDENARKYGLKYRSVTIRASKSRWGSCSGNDDISLSLFLMHLPRHLIEYVIIHELCHTVHKNHSDKFYALLDSFLGGREKTLNKELKAYRPDII